MEEQNHFSYCFTKLVAQIQNKHLLLLFVFFEEESNVAQSSLEVST